MPWWTRGLSAAVKASHAELHHLLVCDVGAGDRPDRAGARLYRHHPGPRCRTKASLALRSSAIAAAIRIVTALLGNWFLAQLRIGLAAFQISGGILLFGVATRMIFGEHMRQESREAESAAREKIADLAAFPLAIPLIAGPGAITATLLLASRTGGDPLWLLALVLIIACGNRIGRVLPARRRARATARANRQYRARAAPRYRARCVRYAVCPGRGQGYVPLGGVNKGGLAVERFPVTQER
jgi:hypothetical protein